MKTGLVVLGRDRWYGPGYCGICGHRGESLLPRAVRWWDPDDGWKMGVLCEGCTDDADSRPPRPSDYAYNPDDMTAEKIDLLYSLGDADGTYSETSQEY